ncbi:sigma factor-like helix-turn-helix DNA-binding protein [Microlunatus antarcticus]|uniref:DNA-binding NarL/FixJ family response regulator n=1 Tax=Microlunatus antarcticus TaxID=53388 RepID=A0A7W5P7B7_9ACTN|nr:DNA-binding NarL/FixJ family response regulator [Microlunatus antarcticus]
MVREATPITVVVADDHDVVWIGLVAAARLGSGRPVRLRGHATNAATLLAIVEQQAPDVVVLDLVLGDGSDPGDTVARVVAAGSRVLVYSVLDNPRLIRSALAAGAHGLSRKSEPVQVTVDKLRQVAAGQTLVSPEILAMIDGDTDFVRARLSEREREVLVLYVSGLEISQIAQQLFVTENSAREYLRRIRAKYTEVERPASTKVDLLRRAIEDGIVPPIEPR